MRFQARCNVTFTHRSPAPAFPFTTTGYISRALRCNSLPPCCSTRVSASATQTTTATVTTPLWRTPTLAKHTKGYKEGELGEVKELEARKDEEGIWKRPLMSTVATRLGLAFLMTCVSRLAGLLGIAAIHLRSHKRSTCDGP
jgi:hypothetical protein